MNREKAVTLGEKLECVMRAFALEHGLMLGRKRVRFDSAGFTFSVDMSEVSESGASRVDEETYKRSAPLHGLDADTFGKSFVSRETRFTISGFLPRARVQPVLADAPDGRRFRFEPDYIKMLAKTGGLS